MTPLSCSTDSPRSFRVRCSCVTSAPLVFVLLHALVGCPDTTARPLAADTGTTDAASDATIADASTPIPDDCPLDTFLDLGHAPGSGPAYPATTLTVTCTADRIVVGSNGFPPYTFVQTTVNPLVGRDRTYEIPLHPAVAPAPTHFALLALVAVAVNGMPIFTPNEAAVPADTAYGDPIYNGITDACLGHTSPTDYHYHALVEKCLTQENLVAEPWTTPDATPPAPSRIIAYATDGFPVFGPHECVDSACFAVVTMESSWERTGDPTTNAWDAYAYVAKAGATYLDECNGHVGPNGDYHYHATATFPYVIGCFRGTPVRNGGGGG